MPKRPPNAYLQWCNAERDRVKEQHPELSRTEISKFLSERWKTVTQEEKQVSLDTRVSYVLWLRVVVL